MTILLQLLYLFRSLPIPIPNSYLRSLQSILSSYIWKGKKPRVARAWLTKHRSVGGSGLVDIADYYHSTVLTQLREWFLTKDHSLWEELERCLVPGRNLKLWLYSLHSKSKHLSPTILASVKTWWKFISMPWLNTPRALTKLPISILALLIPGINTWPKDTQLNDLVLNSRTKSFNQLQSDLNISNTLYYQYLQIAHCIHHNPHLLAPIPV